MGSGKSTGRPTKYRPEYAEKVIEFGRAGKSLTNFAASIEVSRDTLHEWASTRPAFSDAMKKHAQLAESYWETIGSRAATGQPLRVKDPETGIVTETKVNPTLWIFYMKARFGWKDRVAIESAPEDKPTGFGFVETETEKESD